MQQLKASKFIDEMILSPVAIELGILNFAQVFSDVVGNRGVTIVPILTGGMFYAVALAKHLHMPVQIWPIVCSSYKGQTKAVCSPQIMTPIDESQLRFENVLIVDDILDTGETITTVLDCMRKMKPKHIFATTLLEKESSPLIAINIPVFTISDTFVVGFGLDWKGLFRNLPFIATLKEEYLNE